ncbi:MAG: hypothetical protein HY647_12025, partial [Acidobacteria bacterium]|nr:hypothetical protein [Acidobacteriota bacterium]
MLTADSGEAARTEGIRIAHELALQLRHRVQGLLVSTPLGRYSTAVEVLGALSDPDRQAVAAGGACPEKPSA